MCRQAEIEMELLLHNRVLSFNFCADSKLHKLLLSFQGQIFSLFLLLPVNVPRAVVFYMKHTPDSDFQKERGKKNKISSDFLSVLIVYLSFPSMDAVG